MQVCSWLSVILLWFSQKHGHIDFEGFNERNATAKEVNELDCVPNNRLASILANEYCQQNIQEGS
jgi:hypothetical protein